ncbi:MAG: zinc metallopeptidase [Anaerovoracaceae bacterium]|jgi:Zn-dependent membrane protease YugP
MFYYDYTIIILIPAMALAFYAQHRVKSAYSGYSRVATAKGFTGAQVARRILDTNGLRDVPIERVSGIMTDHYHPGKRVMRLSNQVYSGTSIASVSIAAHESGHAIQHGNGYAPLKIRNGLAPIASFGSKLSWLLLLGGLALTAAGSIEYYSIGAFIFDLGIIMYASAVLFQVITLPVELNASKRALIQLDGLGLITLNERRGAKKMLSAAALTYIAAMAVAIANLMRLLLIRGRNN